MDDEATQPCTQGQMDPRRLGRNNSGLSEADVSDVMCILHPCSPAAFRIVATTAERTPQNVLQNYGAEFEDDDLTQSVLEEQETFILHSDGPNQAMDLALRFTAEVVNPALGFVFGRNAHVCDILATDNYKRVSNMHFRIFMNDSGVLMLQDMSTNGTMVDDILLRAKAQHAPQTRMLNTGSIIQILSTNPDEIVKFVVRIPSREGHIHEYEEKFQYYIRRMAHAAGGKAKQDDVARQLALAREPRSGSGVSYKTPLVHNQYGMHWSGGDKYNVVGLIGKGAFATVYQLATKSEGQLFAAKELEKRKFMKNGVLDRKLDNEMQIMKAISHPNIVQYVDYQDAANHLYIIMEFVPCGDLQQYLPLHGPLTEDLGKRVAVQVLDSLAYLHAKKITHRDIKPDNILLANMDPEHFSIKLSDFGLSKVVKDNDTFLKTFCGTLLYCAPEVFPMYDAHRGQKRPRKSNGQTKFHSYSQSVDIWSFGAVLWYSMCLKPPFEGVADNTGRGMFEKIMMTPLDATDLTKQGVSDDAVALLAEMLNTDPSLRPSPVYCLRHKWFGFEEAARTGALQTEGGLRAIAEEEEGEGAVEADVSSLSLDEHASSNNSEDSQYADEVSIHSGSMNFFGARQSKRFKSGVFEYRDQTDMIDSSPELLHQSIPIVLQASEATPQETKGQQRRLFGEVTQSALDLAAISRYRASMTAPTPEEITQSQPESQDQDDNAQQEDKRGLVASPSLLGAESLMRDVHMDSPQADSPADEPNEPTTPHTPAGSHALSKAHASPNGHEEVTPKQVQHRVFSRQIKIDLPPSFWYDPEDQTTHTLEHASKVSGRDYVSKSSYAVTAQTSLLDTIGGSATDNDHEEEELHGDTDAEVDPEPPKLSQPAAEFVKPPPRLGRLATTPDSFVQTTLNLSERYSTWGRAPSNTHRYPDDLETRVPKRGIIIYFHAKDIDKHLENNNWLKLPDLHCCIATESRAGLFINGVELKKGEPGKTKFGRLYTGDEILVCRRGVDGTAGLSFKCEIFHGEGKQRRPEGTRFQIETGGSVDARHRVKGKGKDKEYVLPEKIAAA